MALPATVVWEVRPTTGAANNGGGFNSAAAGTDRSQQASAQVVINNSTITCTTPAANSNTLTFTAGYTPSAADVGNVVAITAGTNVNAGLYEITGQTGTTWTLAGAANLTTATAGGSAITGNMGGARSGFSTGTTPVQALMLAGHIAYVKNEAWNEAVAISSAGTASNPITVEGYNTARGDAPTGSIRPTNDRAAAAGAAIALSGANVVIKYLIAKSAAGNGFTVTANQVRFIGCRATGNGAVGFSGAINGIEAIACEADNNTTRGFDVTTGRMRCVGCWSRSNTLTGYQCTTGTMTLIHCLATKNSSHGIAMITAGGIMELVHVTSDGNVGATADGLNIVTGNTVLVIALNCIFSNNGRYGTNTNATPGPMWFDYNNYFGNGTADRNNTMTGQHDFALDPQYTDSTNDNYAIGTNLKAAGFPGVMPYSGGLTGSTGYADLGAVQRQEAASGSGYSRGRVVNRGA